MEFLKTIKEGFFGPSTDYKELIKNGAIVVDVRTPEEFRSGHAKGSTNIPLSTLGNKLSQLKNKEVVLVCRSGARAGQAKGLLERNGITSHNAGAWQNVQ